MPNSILFYYLRSYAFFGNKAISVRSKSESPVVKGSCGFDLEIVAESADVVALRHELGFDFGKFDYVIHNGDAVLLDINSTPIFGKVFSPEVKLKVVSTLAEGISQWFPDVKNSPAGSIV